MKYLLTILTLVFICSTNGYGQKKVDLATQLKAITKKGDYAILEVRLNKEDEFRTIEGSSSSLTRIAIFTGNNKGKEIISKNFEGLNAIVAILNNLKHHGWILIKVYSIKGESLIITHYVLERKK